MTDDYRPSTVETSQINNNKSKYNMKLLNFIFMIKIVCFKFFSAIWIKRILMGVLLAGGKSLNFIITMVAICNS